MYLAAVAPKPNIAVSSVTGLGLTWSQIGVQCAARSQTRVEVWAAQGAGSDGTVTATMAGTPSNTVIVVTRYSGAGGIGTVVAANTLGNNGACAGGTDNSAYNTTLTTPANNSVVYVAATMRNRLHTPGTAYAERIERMQGTGGSAASAAVADQAVATAGSVTVDGSFSGAVDWAIVAVAVLPSGGGLPPTPTPTSGPTQVPSPTSTPTPTTMPTLTPSSTPTVLPSATPTATSTPLATPTNGAATATATNTAPPTASPTPTATPTSGGAAPTHELSVAGGAVSSDTVTSPSLSAGSSGDLYLAVVAPKPNVAVTSVTGLGLTQTRVEVWAAQGAGQAGTVTATLASTPSAAVIEVSRYNGASGIGAVVSANPLGDSGACSGGTDNGAYGTTLTTTVDNSRVFVAPAMRNRTHTPGAGYTERVEHMAGSGGSAASAASADKVVPTAGSTAVNGSFSGAVDWAVVAVEVKP
ncbi:hypothetical protein DCC79_16595 [bacterium]|nr:MAG: hypothetical protein DCC79_16595 [bacterium]